MFQRPNLSSWRRVGTPIALALVSLTAAVVLWVAVTDAENPRRVAVFTGAIEVHPANVPDGMAVAAIRPPSISLRVSAPEDEFSRLTTADFRAEVDLSGARQSAEQVVRVSVVSNKDVEIVDWTPQLVSVDLEPVASKLVPVQAHFVGSPAQGYNVDPAAATANPATVRVSGATSLVQLVASASADVNLTGLRASVQQTFSLTPRDSRGADLRGLSLEPANAQINVPVSQQEVTLALTVVASLQGTVAEGYNLVGASADPPAVPISGPLEVLQALSYLTTEPIDVSGLKADTTRTARLRLPSGLQSNRDSVSVRLRVVPADGQMTLSVAPQVTGIGANLSASLQTASVNVRLSGALPDLRALQSGSVRAVVDASGLGEGVHVLNPTITKPDNVSVVSFDPQQVVVVLRR